MELGGPEDPHGLGVSGRDVPDVRDEPVARVESVQAPHHAVSHHLRHDRGGRDRSAAGVAVDDGPVRRRRRTEPEPVDKADVCGRMEIPENCTQSREIRAVETGPVDLTRRHDSHADRRGAGGDGLEEHLALVRQDLLRVVQRRERSNARAAQELVVEQHTGDHQRPCERSAASFICPGHEADTETSIEREKTLAGGSSHAAENTDYLCRSSRTRAFFPTLLRK